MTKIFVIEVGGKQYRVSPEDEIWVEKLNKKPGEIIEFENLLSLSKVTPSSDRVTRSDTHVKAEVGETKLGPKISIFKFKPKKGYQKRIGHRQPQTLLKIL